LKARKKKFIRVRKKHNYFFLSNVTTNLTVHTSFFYNFICTVILKKKYENMNFWVILDIHFCHYIVKNKLIGFKVNIIWVIENRKPQNLNLLSKIPFKITAHLKIQKSDDMLVCFFSSIFLFTTIICVDNTLIKVYWGK
jgi:hypothetical protein